MRKNITLATTLPIALLIGLSGCGGTDSQPEESASAEATSSQIDASSLSLDDAWVKAADDGMTAVFGELRNGTDQDINLVAAEYSGAETAQLHETTEDGSGGMSMQEKKGGFTIPAKGSLELKPGGEHIMIMGLKKAIKPGEEISVKLVTADKQSVDVTAVAKDYSGAQENYAPGEAEAESDSGSEAKAEDDGDHAGHGHDEHGDDEHGDMDDHGEHSDH